MVVVTGASSGIGRATALALARQGDTVVVAARSESSLEEVAAECRALGGTAMPVVTDVSDEAQVERLAAVAYERFGRIDVWIGAAGVYAWGRFDETPDAVFRRIVEVNFWGQVFGARAALKQFRERGRGTLIMVGSVYSRTATPYVSAYAASKHAVLGLSETLRQELAEEGIDVCCVLPVTADTPIYQHAGVFTGHEMRPLPPVIDPERVARAIVRLTRRPKPWVYVGRMQRMAITIQHLAPRLYGYLTPKVMRRLVVRDTEAPPSDGTVFAPDPESNRVDGGWS